MTTRLSTMTGRTPISDRIKMFDNGGGTPTTARKAQLPGKLKVPGSASTSTATTTPKTIKPTTVTAKNTTKTTKTTKTDSHTPTPTPNTKENVNTTNKDSVTTTTAKENIKATTTTKESTKPATNKPKETVKTVNKSVTKTDSQTVMKTALSRQGATTNKKTTNTPARGVKKVQSEPPNKPKTGTKQTGDVKGNNSTTNIDKKVSVTKRASVTKRKSNDIIENVDDDISVLNETNTPAEKDGESVPEDITNIEDNMIESETSTGKTSDSSNKTEKSVSIGEVETIVEKENVSGEEVGTTVEKEENGVSIEEVETSVKDNSVFIGEVEMIEKEEKSVSIGEVETIVEKEYSDIISNSEYLNDDNDAKSCDSSESVEVIEEDHVKHESLTINDGISCDLNSLPIDSSENEYNSQSVESMEVINSTEIDVAKNVGEDNSDHPTARKGISLSSVHSFTHNVKSEEEVVEEDFVEREIKKMEDIDKFVIENNEMETLNKENEDAYENSVVEETISSDETNYEVLDKDTIENKKLDNESELEMQEKNKETFDPKYNVDKIDNKKLLEDNEILKEISEKISPKVQHEAMIMNTNMSSQFFTQQALNNITSSSISKAMKLDTEYKDDKLSHLTRQLDNYELSSISEDEVKRLKKQKHDLESRLKEQEDELDDMASQVQILETSKSKLESQFQQLKKEHRREIEGKEDELEEARAAAVKKVKILEEQLEQEHEERISFLRERHELEGKIMNLQDMLERSGDEEQVSKLRKDLKKTKALLNDAHMEIDKTQTDGTNKVIMRQLKNQLEDAEFARSVAMKSRQNVELELSDVQTQLEDVSRSKSDLEERNMRLCREKADITTQLQENEEELQDVMRKYKASVAAVSTDQITIQDQAATIQELENERNKLREQMAEISQRLNQMEGENVSTSQHKRLELKIKEYESKMELEKTTKGRLETQVLRHKEVAEKLQREVDDLRMKESVHSEELKKSSRQQRDLKEEYASLEGKISKVSQKKMEIEKQLEVAQSETQTAKNELKVANKRIDDLQAAISGEIDSDKDSDQDSDSSDEDMTSFLDQKMRNININLQRV